MTTTEDVLRFLKKNPNFFSSNADELAKLNIAGSNGADPFAARQLAVLRQRQREQTAKLNLIVDGAKHNLKREDDFLEFAVRLVGERKIGIEAQKMASTLLIKQFNVKASVFVMDEENRENRHQNFHEIRQRVAHKSSVCDDRVAQTLLKNIFRDEAADINSMAFIPLMFDDNVQGVLILGSTSEDRFAPGVGVNFLDKLGLLVGSYIQASREN